MFFCLRRLRGKETHSGLRERFGQTNASSPKARVIWLHGASNGELTAARAMITTLLERDPQLSMVITMNSYTARDMVRGWNIRQITPCLAPLDYRVFIRRFLKTWQPLALISLENELWPNRMAECRRADIPVLIVGGRLSARAASFWRAVPGLATAMLSGVAYLAPQDDTSRVRFLGLGLAADNIGPILNLKSSVSLQGPNPDDLHIWAALFPHETTILAASTHEGEDKIILDAYEMARLKIPELRLILAPRHPNRAPSIAKLCSSRPITYARKSDSTPPQHAPDVLLADTLGEMALWYRLAFATFVGGSLVEKGGHTPIEPMQFRSAVLHGPNVSNHRAAFSRLDDVSGAVEICDAKSLSAAIIHLSDASRRDLMLCAADKVLSTLRAETDGESAVINMIFQLQSTASI